jgi:prepilin-type processing-associated H-X9-DG protein
VHDLTTEAEIAPIEIKMYNCPSRRSLTLLYHPSNNLTVSLTDYAGIHPCTKIWSTDAQPLDLTTQPDAPTVRNYFVKPAPDQPGYSDVPTNRGCVVPADGVYDGVIVRSPWRADPGNYDARSQKMAGIFASNVPNPITMAKITDGTAKTMLVGEKYLRSDFYSTGGSSDDRGWTDGWDPDTMRCTCIQPINDSNCDKEHSPCPPAFENSSYYTLIMGSAHPGAMNAVFADGSVRGIDYEVDLFVLNGLGTRNSTSAGPLIGGKISAEVGSESGAN